MEEKNIPDHFATERVRKRGRVTTSDSLGSDNSPGKKNELEEGPGLTLIETCRFIIFALLFGVVLLNQLRTENAYHIAATTFSLLKTESYNEIQDLNDISGYIINDMIPIMLNPYAYYDLSSTLNGENIRFAWFNRVISPIRIVQKQMKTVANPVERTNSLFKEKWGAPTLSPFSDSQKFESKEAFGDQEQIKQVLEECRIDKSMFEYDDDAGVESSGGFQYLIWPDPNVYTIKVCTSKIFSDLNWINELTAALYIDFAMYNAHYDMMVYAAIEFSFLHSGIVEKSMKVRSMQTELYSTLPNFIRAGFEILCVLMVVFYAILEIIEIKTVFGKLSSSEKQDRIDKEDISDEDPELFPQRKRFRCLVILYKSIVRHLSCFWNVLDITSLLLSFIAIGIWVNILVTRPNGIIDTSVSTINDVLLTINLLTFYVRISGINICIIFLRLIKYLGRFERIQLLQSTFKRAGGEIFYFFIILISIFLSFAIFGHLAFGQIFGEYRSIYKSLISCLLLLLNVMDTTLELLTKNFLISSFFLVSFTLMINFILTNMFIAIITTAYAEKLEKLEEQKKKKQTKEEDHVYNRIKAKLVNIFNKIAGRCSRKYALKIMNKARRIDNVNPENKIRVENHHLEYLQVQAMNKEINTEVLNDRETKERLGYRSKILSKKVRSAFIFIVFAIVYTGVMVEQQKIHINYDLHYATQQNVKNFVYSIDKTLQDVNDFNSTMSWLSSAFNSVHADHSNAYIVHSNFIVGSNLETVGICDSKIGSIRLSFRKVKLTDNESEDFEVFEEYKRKDTFSPDSKSPDEFKQTLKQNGCVWTHSDNSGFADAGGYLFYTRISNFAEDLETLGKNDYFLDDYINSITIEYVLYNGDNNYFVYFTLAILFDSSGKVSHEFYIRPMNLMPYNSETDNVVRAAFEVLFLLLLLYHILVTAFTLYNEYKNYESWRVRFYGILTPKQIKKRNKAKPEWLRRLTNILTSYVIIDIMSYTCSIVAVVYWFLFVRSPGLSTMLFVTKQEFIDDFNQSAKLLDSYLTWSAFSLLFIYVRILNYLTIKRSLMFLQDTLKVATSDILYFLIMLLGIVMGYVFMGYICFGHTLNNYSSIYSSLMTCFSIIIGELNYPELEETDFWMSLLFFFSLAIFSMYILLNIFIAILERAFNLVNSEAKQREKTNFIEFLLLMFVKTIKRLVYKPAKDKRDIVNVVLADNVFGAIELGDEIYPNGQQWAAKVAGEILIEREKRRECFQPLEELFRRRKIKEIEIVGNIFKEKSNMNEECKARADYWNYLRTGYLKFKKQKYLLEGLAWEHVDRIEDAHPRFMDTSQRIEWFQGEIADLLNRLDKNKAKLAAINRRSDSCI